MVSVVLAFPFLLILVLYHPLFSSKNLIYVDTVIPVDCYVPGCAARPEAIIDGVVAGFGVLAQKRAAMIGEASAAPAADEDMAEGKEED